MIKNIFRGFDAFRALFISLLLNLVFFWGFQTNNFIESFAIASGILCAFFPNIEGNNTERFWGMLFCVIWTHVCLGFFHFFQPFSDGIHLSLMALLVGISSLMAVFGYRGIMVSFGGIFGLVMGYTFEHFEADFLDSIKYSLGGSAIYLLIGVISQILYQPRNIDILLKNKIHFIKVLIVKHHELIFGESIYANKISELRAKVKINELQEMLRNMLMHDRKVTFFSSQKKKQLAIFRVLVDVYELALAMPSHSLEANKDTGYSKEIIEPFEAFSKKFVLLLREIENHNPFGSISSPVRELEDIWRSCELAIQNYVKAFGPIMVRDRALNLRSYLDFYATILEKLKKYNLIVEAAEVDLDERDFEKYVTPQNYSLQAVQMALNIHSPVLRFSIRLTIAFILGTTVGHFLDPKFSNWILVTVIIIMRPEYVLTKKRAYYRLFGTIIGLGMVGIAHYSGISTFVWGGLCMIAVFIGFLLINKNYAWASAFITFALISMLFFNGQPFDILLRNRILYSMIGVVLVFLVNLLVFPVWEKDNFKLYLKRVLRSNLQYFNAMYTMYSMKKDSDEHYRLARKKAFVDNAQIATVFENIQNNPESKKSEANNYHALILLSQEFIGSIASFATYIQSHQTTEVSEQFDIIKNYIKENLNKAIDIVEGKSNTTHAYSDTIEEALDFLHSKYTKLNHERNQEIASGIAQMKPETRLHLQEGKVVLEQLESFIQISEGILGYAKLLFVKG
ncbi:MAG: FUSC family protein [Leadbetterella sp.]